MGVKIYYYTTYEEALNILSEGIIRVKDGSHELGVYFTEVAPNFAKTRVQLNTYNDGLRCLQSSKRVNSLSADVCLAFDAKAIGAKLISTKWWRNEWMTTNEVNIYGISQMIIKTD